MDRPTILHGNINFLLKDYFPTNFFNRCIAMCEKVLQNCFFDFLTFFKYYVYKSMYTQKMQKWKLSTKKVTIR